MQLLLLLHVKSLAADFDNLTDAYIYEFIYFKGTA